MGLPVSGRKQELVERVLQGRQRGLHVLSTYELQQWFLTVRR